MHFRLHRFLRRVALYKHMQTDVLSLVGICIHIGIYCPNTGIRHYQTYDLKLSAEAYCTHTKMCVVRCVVGVSFILWVCRINSSDECTSSHARKHVTRNNEIQRCLCVSSIGSLVVFHERLPCARRANTRRSEYARIDTATIVVTRRMMYMVCCLCRACAFCVRRCRPFYFEYESIHIYTCAHMEDSERHYKQMHRCMRLIVCVCSWCAIIASHAHWHTNPMTYCYYNNCCCKYYIQRLYPYKSCWNERARSRAATASFSH